MEITWGSFKRNYDFMLAIEDRNTSEAFGIVCFDPIAISIWHRTTLWSRLCDPLYDNNGRYPGSPMKPSNGKRLDHISSRDSLFPRERTQFFSTLYFRPRCAARSNDNIHKNDQYSNEMPSTNQAELAQYGVLPVKSNVLRLARGKRKPQERIVKCQ